MPIASGVAKVVAYKKESTFGVLAGAVGAKQVRRTKSDLSLKKQTYDSNEIRTDYQDADSRHGVRSVGGGIEGELSPGSYQDPIASALRRLFTAVAAITGMTIGVAGTGPTYTLTRSAGDFLAGNIKIGMVVRLTAGTFNAANLNKNLLVVAMTATVLTVIPLNGVALFVEAGITAATLSVPGMITYTPTSGHIDESYTVEHWFSDISRSEVFTGVKFDQVDFGLPATGLTTVKFGAMGKDLGSKGAAQYFTTPTAPGSSGIFAAVNGAVVVGGVVVGLLTGMNFTINGGYSAEPTVGSNTYADIQEGRVKVEGQMTVQLQDSTFLDYFDGETEFNVVVALTTGSGGTADFMSFAMPRCKAKGNDKDDGEKAIIQTVPFKALRNPTASAGSEQTTLWVQDSLAV